MMVIKSYPRLISFSLALCLELAMNGAMPATATSHSIRQQRSPHSSQELIAQRRSRLRFKVPNVRPSRNLEGGAARGYCGDDALKNIQMKALLPNTNIGLTAVEKPTFFFQVSPTSIGEAKFLLLDAESNTILYKKNFPIMKTGGIMSFTLPDDAQTLEVGKEYSWELAVLCDPNDQTGNPRVQGSIKRMPPSQELARALVNVSLRDRANLYASEGYWYDSLKTLADLRAANPNDPTLVGDWKELLDSVGLSSIDRQPLVQCCTPKSQ